MPAPLVDGPFAPQAPRRHHAPVRIAPETYLIRSVFGEGDGPVAVYVNSMVITGPEPVVIDTGTMVNREDWFRDLTETTTTTTSATSCRCSLELVRPPLYDAPTTRGLLDTSTGVYWAVDTYGCPIVDPVTEVADLDPEFWNQWFMGFNPMNSPWSALADPDLFGRQVDRIEELDASVIASAHGPLITGRFVEQAHRMMRSVPGAQAPPPPTQLDLDAMLAELGRDPELV